MDGAGADPSMEDILASIRRILNEDEVTPPSPEAGGPHAPAEPPAEPNAGGSGGDEEDGVLVLDEAMLVTAPEPGIPQPGPDIATPTAGGFDPPQMFPLPIAVPVAQPPPEPPPAIAKAPPTTWPDLPPGPAEPSLGEGLLAPESEAAAASSVGALLRTISQERSSQVHRGGPTIEDLVREEIRPLLKYWLDTHLPPLVERLVRQEIERVTGRAAP
jgi:cell pole-organizing protein PopZ